MGMIKYCMDIDFVPASNLHVRISEEKERRERRRVSKSHQVLH